MTDPTAPDGDLRIGLVTPVVTRVPGAHGHWERSAGVDELIRIATEADRLGFHHLTCSEHVAVPVTAEPTRGATYWDPLATLAFLAAHTSRIRLVTSVLVLGYHHPLAIAKRYGTLDLLSRGRLVLGLGVGSLEEEFDLLAAPFADRGARADDALRALRESLSTRVPAYAGTHYRYRDFVVDPASVQDPVPLWIGGRTRRSLRRAVELADGWIPFGLSPDQLGRMLTSVGDRPAGFEVILSAPRALDPLTDPSRTEAALHELEAVGATVVAARLVARSCEQYLDQLEALASLADLAPPQPSS